MSTVSSLRHEVRRIPTLSVQVYAKEICVRRNRLFLFYCIGTVTVNRIQPLQCL